MKEVGIALGSVVAILLVLTLYTQVWPPMVVVESGSMMHPEADAYGNLGTIDPGDLVLVKQVDQRTDVQLYVEGGKERYGRSGDVIVYYPGNERFRTPIIHRAMSYVWVEDGGCEWIHPDEERRVSCDAGRITYEDWGLRDWEPQHSGFITLGDNNGQADQASGSIGAVRLSWIQGEARGEVPWLGLLKLAMSPGVNQPNAPQDWTRVGNAYAPHDLWVMLGVVLVVLLVLPAAVDAGLTEARRHLHDRDRGDGDDEDPP